MRSYRGAGTYWSDDHHTGTAVEHDKIDDGRWHHKFGASWVKTVDLCAERARLEAMHEMPNVESDAANVGTACHSAFEANLDLWALGEALSRSDSLELFNDEFSLLMAHPDFSWKKYTERSARKFGMECVAAFYDEVLFTLPQEGRNEIKFVLPIYEDDERVIEMSGAIDRVDEIIRDWKTNGSRKYEEWEYKRWNVQATTYTWAAVQLGLVPPDADSYPFEFCVMMPKGVHRFEVRRDIAHWDFLRSKVTNIARLIESGVAPWPLNDNHALCSPKWCPAWDQCKGKNGLEF